MVKPPSLKTLLDDLRAFVAAEQRAQRAKLTAVWQKPLAAKLQSGESQGIASVQVAGKNQLLLCLGEGESRFREGDMICLHQGHPMESTQVYQATIEADNEAQWLLRTANQDLRALRWETGAIYADPDTMDLSPFFHKALNELASSTVGRTIILPLLAGELDSHFIYTDNYDEAADFAEEQGCNASQIDAVAKGVAAKYLACIQGPPGSGKTRVISLIVNRLVAEGQRVLVTSHTHLAINNALNAIAEQDLPLVKVGHMACNKGLNNSIKHVSHGGAWQPPANAGYVIGATPFATCSARLEQFQFDTVIFDEASQVTVPLALMAMGRARRYVFVGDHKQLPPVVLSQSVLDSEGYSIFAKLMSSSQACSTMLSETYRMNQQLARWPALNYYQGKLIAAGANASRQFTLPRPAKKHRVALSAEHSCIFIESPGSNAKTSNPQEAALIIDLLQATLEAGMPMAQLGLVTPFRNQAKLLRNAMRQAFGQEAVNAALVDTVERMQGQEREMVIVSLCSTDPAFLRAIAGFLFQSQRINVALTRAKTKLIVVGPTMPEPDHSTLAVRDRKVTENIADYRHFIHSAYTYRANEV